MRPAREAMSPATAVVAAGSIDLHTHSTASDGTFSPVELVDHARQSGLAGLALTDHDTLNGIAAARRRAAACGLRFLAGVELSTSFRTVADVHLLGYRVDGPRNPPLLRACDALRQSRQERAAAIAGRLAVAGAAVPWSSIAATANGAPVGRPHIARALVEAGFASDIKDAFQRWLVPGAPGYLPKQALNAVEAVGLVRAAGGAAVLAHPGTLRLAEADLRNLVRALKDAGLAGLECYWFRHDAATIALCERLARDFQLLRTGGSDFHGANKPGIPIGALAAGYRQEVAIVDALEQNADGADDA